MNVDKSPPAGSAASRRDWLKTVGAGASALVAAGLPSVCAAAAPDAAPVFPTRAMFSTLQGCYLNSAAHHPMSNAAVAAITGYASKHATGASASVSSAEVQAKFAALINADADEVCYVPSTSVGEYLVNASLDIPHAGGRIVTDALHFVGSYYMYEQFGQQGMDVVTLRLDADGLITPAQYAAAIVPGTRLVALSLVSFVNGFEQDVKAIAEIAHARGALVYVDLIQAAGTIPVDVKALGVDFASCGTYKWLMGDFGLAFLYVRKALLPRLKRPWLGYLQTRNFVTPITRLYPGDPAGDPPYQSVQRNDVQGVFNGSFPARPVEAAVGASLDWIARLGVAGIQRIARR